MEPADQNLIRLPAQRDLSSSVQNLLTSKNIRNLSRADDPAGLRKRVGVGHNQLPSSTPLSGICNRTTNSLQRSSVFVNSFLKSCHHFMQEGSFYCFVPRQAAALPWLTFGKSPDRQVQERFDDLLTRGTLTRAKRSKPISSLDNSSSDQLHILPGGGIQIQHGIRKVAGELQRTQPHVYSTKSAVIVFTGYLSNLSELLDRCQLQDSIPEPRSPIFRNTSTSFDINGDVDQGTLAAQIVLHMYLRARADQSFILLLAELQGQYSFVVYDSTKRQVFAARDPSGEPQCTLYYNLEDDGDVSLTNKPFEVEGSVIYAAWTEVPPGHFLSGKQANLQQYALTPAQLYTREVHQSMDDDRPASLDSSGELTPHLSRRETSHHGSLRSSDDATSLFSMSV